eukprot:s80_g32.t1
MKTMKEEEESDTDMPDLPEETPQIVKEEEDKIFKEGDDEDDMEDVEDAANRSLFQDLPAKLQPVLGRRLPLWQVEAAVIGIIVVVMLLIVFFLLKGKKAPAQSYTLPAPPAGDQEAGEGTLDQKLAQVCVLGGGVVGTAIARELAHRGVETILLDPGRERCRGNSPELIGLV